MIAMKFNIPSNLHAMMKVSVPMNGVHVPFNRCLDNLSRFCRPLMFHNDDAVFDLSYSGSSFLFRHCERNLMLCTRHQLVNQSRAAQDVVLILDDLNEGKVALTPNEVTQVIFPVPEHKNLEDISLVEYHSKRNNRNLDPHFFQLDLNHTADLRSVPPEMVLLIFSIGYPTRFSSFDTSYDDEYNTTGYEIISRWCKVYLTKTEPTAWDRESRIPLRVHEDWHAEIGDPDGFSGSPVFFLYQDETKQAHLGFVGMITDANCEGRFAVYEAAHIREVVNGIACPDQVAETP